MATGTQMRDYLFIDDLTAGILQAIAADVTGVFQLGTGKGTSLLDLIGIIRSTVGADYPVEVAFEPARAGEVHATWCQIDKARAGFGFDPRTSLPAGVAQTWQWFKGEMLDEREAALVS